MIVCTVVTNRVEKCDPMTTKPRVVRVCSKDPVTGEVHCYDKVVDDGEPND